MPYLNTLLKKNIKWTSLSTISRLIIEVARMLILMRILDPEPFGVFAIALLFINFSEVLINLGLTETLVWKEHIKKAELGAIQRWQFIVSLILAGILIIFSGFLSKIYVAQELSTVLPILSIGLLFQGYSLIHQNIQARHLNFTLISQVTIISTILSFLLTLLLAYNGYGIWALVWGSLFHTAFAATYYLIKSPIQLNLLFHKRTGISSYQNYGKWILVDNILNFFTKEIDILIFGVGLSSIDLGLYRNAKLFSQKPLDMIKSVINKLTFPTLSHVRKTNKEKVLTLYFLQASGLVLFYAYTLLFIYGDWLITMLFKPTWRDLIPYLNFFIILFIIRRLSIPFTPLLLARGKSELSFKLKLVQTVILILVFSGIIFYPVSYLLIAWISVEVLFYFVRYQYIAQPLLRMSFIEYLWETLRISLPIFLIVTVHMIFSIEFSNYTLILLDVIVISVVYWILVYIFNQKISRIILREIWKK